MSHTPVDLEIIEYVPTQGDLDKLNDLGVIRPNAVLLNGQKLLLPRDKPVTLHEIEIEGDDVVQVTMSLYVRRTQIEARLSE